MTLALILGRMAVGGTANPRMPVLVECTSGHLVGEWP